MREDTHYHGWTLRYPVAIADRTALVDPARGDAVDLCTARADPRHRRLEPRLSTPGSAPPSPRPFFLDLPALPRPPAPAPTSPAGRPKREAEGAAKRAVGRAAAGPSPRRGAPGATDPAPRRGAAVDPSGPEVPPDRLRLARAVYPAESGREWERQGGEVEAYVSRPAGGPASTGALACAERPLRGALAFAEGLPAAAARGRRGPRPLAPAPLRGGQRRDRRRRAARELPPLVLPDAAAAPYPARADLGTDTVEYASRPPAPSAATAAASCASTPSRGRPAPTLRRLRGGQGGGGGGRRRRPARARARAQSGARGPPGARLDLVDLGVQRAVHRGHRRPAVAAGLLPASTGLLGATEPRATSRPCRRRARSSWRGWRAPEERLAAPAGSPDGRPPGGAHPLPAGGHGDGKTRACVSISRAIVADPAASASASPRGSGSILYLVAGRLHAPEIQRDPEWATVARWVSTVESVRRFDG
eukprot:tig00021536_g22241.t1